MAPKYSKKKAKFTYAERVLGALSEIQKDHRKHAVHMATLRAQIRKAADARKDRLGPQWSTWVSRTVQRLADDGILDTSDPHGNVTFTPDAKKTITTVRRESLAPGTSPAMEHKIWKDVTRRLSTVGVKRPRKSSGMGVLDDEARPRKKQARKSLSGLTKAELEAELKAALQRLDEAEERQASDAQDDLEELRDELKRREEELEQLRDELDRLKDNEQTARRETIGTVARFLTPPPTHASELSTPSTSRTPAAARRHVSAYGVTRTLSGSLISNLTKRPTPEPSESGSHDAGIEDMIVDDAYGRPSSPHYPLDDGHDTTFNRSLETPQSSPVHANLGELDVDADTRHEHDDRNAEIVSLKNEIEAQASQLQQLRDDQARLLVERDELRLSNGDLERTLAQLQDTVAAVRKELSHAKDEIASKSAELLQALDTVNVLRTSHAQAVSEASEYAREAAALKSSFTELQLTQDQLRSQLVDAAADAADLRARVVTEEASRRSAESQLVATTEERDRLLADVADKTALLATTTGELQQARQATDDARRQIGRLEALRESDVAAHLAERSALESRLETSQIEAARLQTEVEGLSSELSTLSEKLSSVVSERNQLMKVVEEETARASRLEEELSVALDDVRDAEEEIEELRQAKTADEASIQSLKEVLVRLRQVQLDAVEEVNNKMIVTQTAPTPDHRRRSSIAPRQSIM
ncbi:hypothetical protein OH76DRAFT_1488878 [Lentinus brumalis]|uniref:Uncharacterized protein n=1 Tax=Lentinus brumalis TaxID=2498619 RepID=A0A371CPE7_9APHY|nr:hypothetical protein OH76DRAFT_1488878 [Polyporus brumalis]